MPSSTLTQSVTNLDEFLDELVVSGIIRQDEIYPLKSKHQTSGEILESLLKLGRTTEEKIIPIYAKFRGLPYTNLTDADPRYFGAISKNLAQKYWLLPFKITHDALWIAVGYPSRLESGDLAVLQDIEKETGTKIQLSLTARANMEKVFRTPEYQKIAPGKAVWPMQLPHIQLTGKKIAPVVVNKIPQDLAEKYQMVVFEAPSATQVKIAVVDPFNPKVREILDFLREKNDIRIEEYITSPEDFRFALQFYAPVGTTKPTGATSTAAAVTPPPVQKSTVKSKPKELQNIPEVVISEIESEKRGEILLEARSRPVSMEETDLLRFLGTLPKTVDDLVALAKTGNIPKLLAGIIALASALEASDIHVEGWQDCVRIRYRVDGILRDIMLLPIQILPAIVARIKILSKLKIDEQRIPQDGRFDVKVYDHEIDLRVSTLPTIFGEKVVIRLLDKQKGLLSLEALGMMGSGYDRVIEAIKKPWGIVMATGPTGSGKTTTLYAVLREIATSKVNVITLEDPVEYEMVGVNQVQVKPQIGFTFAAGLRAVLRQDPNIVMVGETRDAETANLVTHAALTGHLVLTTLHTNDAAGALPRLINMGVEPFLITSAINAIVAQRLVRKICSHCKEPTEIPPATLIQVKKDIETINVGEPLKFFRGRGCDKCNQGFKGQLGIFEVLSNSDEIENLATARRSANDIKRQAIKDGMVTLRQDGIIKALKGLTTIDEVLRVTTED